MRPEIGLCETFCVACVLRSEDVFQLGRFPEQMSSRGGELTVDERAQVGFLLDGS